MRETVLAIAKSGCFTPKWSARILEEWARATHKLGAGQEAIARGEIALLRAQWPDAEVPANNDLEQTLYLPDVADRHVLAAAIDSNADVLMTMNLRDFPTQTLAEFQILPRHPDAILRDLFAQHPAQIARAVEQVRLQAERLSAQPQPVRPLLKKAGLPRLGKVLAGAQPP